MELDPRAVSILLVALLLLIMLIVRRMVAPEGVTFEDLFAARMDLGWPRGVQEEEPVRWRTELLHSRQGHPKAR